MCLELCIYLYALILLASKIIKNILIAFCCVKRFIYIYIYKQLELLRKITIELDTKIQALC